MSGLSRTFRKPFEDLSKTFRRPKNCTVVRPMRQAAASATCREKPAKFEASNIPESYMRERPSDFGAAQGPGKYGKRQRNKNRRKNQKRGDRRP